MLGRVNGTLAQAVCIQYAIAWCCSQTGQVDVTRTRLNNPSTYETKSGFSDVSFLEQILNAG